MRVSIAMRVTAMNQDSRMKFWNDQIRRAENIQNTEVVAEFLCRIVP